MPLDPHFTTFVRKIKLINHEFMKDTYECIVFRVSDDLKRNSDILGYIKWEGLWITKSDMRRPNYFSDYGQVVFVEAYPTGRFEIREDGEYARVFEIRKALE